MVEEEAAAEVVEAAAEEMAEEVAEDAVDAEGAYESRET